MNGDLRIQDMPHRERPRERLVDQGADALRTSELIAILLRTGLRGRSAISIGEELVRRFSGLDPLARATIDELKTIPGIGRDKAIALKAAFTLARRLAAELQPDAPLLTTSDAVADLLREANRNYDVECFQVLLVNTRRRLIRVERVSQGTLDTILVHPREVFRAAILANAAAIILAHNHPSGDPTPSEADVRVTRDLIRAGQLLRIEVIDHLILGRRSNASERDYVSLRELGYFHS